MKMNIRTEDETSTYFGFSIKESDPGMVPVSGSHGLYGRNKPAMGVNIVKTIKDPDTLSRKQVTRNEVS